MHQQVSGGVVHQVPADFKTVLTARPELINAWEDLTPLARNEWLCWIEEAKQIVTRKRRIQRAESELLAGKRRPCCWMGCVHRRDKALSPSVKYLLSKRH